MFATHSDWLDFVQKRREPAIRVCVLESWRRSLAGAVDPNGAELVKAEPPPETEKDRRPDPHVKSNIEAAVRGMSGFNLAWLIVDSAGRVTDTGAMSRQTQDTLDQIGIRPLVSLEERHAGTNAVALAMVSGKPSFCRGPEHFMRKFHEFSCAAAPFYDIDGSLTGYAAVACPAHEGGGQQLLGMAQLLVHIIDREARIRRLKESCADLKRSLSGLCVNESNPTLMVSKLGFVRQMNPAAVRLFKIESQTFDEKGFERVALFHPPLKEIARSAIPCDGARVSIRLPGKRLSMTYSKIAVYSETEEFLGVRLVLREKDAPQTVENGSMPEAKHRFEDIIGGSAALGEAKETAMRAAKTSVSVLLTGGSGTGKEMFAQSIHNAGDRKDAPFISINCAAIPREIAESELFGYAPGAFTGALRGGGTGKLEAANSGTVFFDEIGDMPIDLQSKLLRALEERAVTRVGESREIPLNIRVIAATNKNLPELCRDGKFREDLFYRLSVTTINLPSLAECADDIPELVRNFINYFNEVMGKKVKGMRDEIMDNFKKYSWPGNIRELRNAVEFAVMMNTGEDFITWKDLPGHIRMELLYSAPSEIQVYDPLHQERQSIESGEKALIDKAVRLAGGNMSRAAEILRVGRATLYRKIKKLGITGIRS